MAEAELLAILERIAARLEAALDEPGVWMDYVLEALAEAERALAERAA